MDKKKIVFKRARSAVSSFKINNLYVEFFFQTQHFLNVIL